MLDWDDLRFFLAIARRSSTRWAKEGVEWDNPFDVGTTGLIGFTSGYHAMMDGDLLLMLGTDLPYRQFYPTGSKVAQVDLRAQNPEPPLPD